MAVTQMPVFAPQAVVYVWLKMKQMISLISAQVAIYATLVDFLLTVLTLESPSSIVGIQNISLRVPVTINKHNGRLLLFHFLLLTNRIGTSSLHLRGFLTLRQVSDRSR
jgi:hypothetical protein